MIELFTLFWLAVDHGQYAQIDPEVREWFTSDPYGSMVKPVLLVGLGIIAVFAAIWCGIYNNGNSLVVMVFCMFAMIGGAVAIVFGSFWFMVASGAGV